MVRILGAVALAATASLSLAGCATSPPTAKIIVPTMNAPTPETETMYAHAGAAGHRPS
jgi:hypothetical protein